MPKRKMTRQEVARLGGRALVAKYGRDHMAEIGKAGNKAYRAKYSIKPVGIGDFMIIEKATNRIMPKTLNGLDISEYGVSDNGSNGKGDNPEG